MRHADRHGRARHPDGDRRRRPTEGFRVGTRRRFAQLVEDALTDLPDRLLRELADAVLVVRDVPPEEPIVGPEPWEPPLATLETGPPRRLVVYRRAIELRASSRNELAEVIRVGAAEAIAKAMGLDGLDDEDWD